MAEMKITVSTEIAYTTGKTVSFLVDGKMVVINVPTEVRADFKNQFVRENPTALQKQKYRTVMRLLEAAFKAGQTAPKK